MYVDAITLIVLRAASVIVKQSPGIHARSNFCPLGLADKNASKGGRAFVSRKSSIFLLLRRARAPILAPPCSPREIQQLSRGENEHASSRRSHSSSRCPGGIGRRHHVGRLRR